MLRGSWVSGELPLFLPAPSFMAPAGEEQGMDGVPFAISFVISLVRIYLLGTSLGGGQRGACNVPPPGKTDKSTPPWST